MVFATLLLLDLLYSAIALRPLSEAVTAFLASIRTSLRPLNSTSAKFRPGCVLFVDIYL